MGARKATEVEGVAVVTKSYVPMAPREGLERADLPAFTLHLLVFPTIWNFTTSGLVDALHKSTRADWP